MYKTLQFFCCQCKELITQYGPSMLENIDNYVDPQAICTEIHACESKKKWSADMLIQLPSSHESIAHQWLLQHFHFPFVFRAFRNKDSFMFKCDTTKLPTLICCNYYMIKLFYTYMTTLIKLPFIHYNHFTYILKLSIVLINLSTQI